MEQKSKSRLSNQLFNSTVLEPKDADEERMERANCVYKSVIKGLSDRDMNDSLNATVSKGPSQHKDIMHGLLYNILVEPSCAAKCLQDMLLVARDGLSTAVSFIIHLVHDKWIRLSERTRAQIVWLTRELVKHGVKESDEMYLWLLRQIVGGDTSPRNVWLAEAMLDIFLDNKAWLEKSHSQRDMVASVVYTYLRLIVDHRECPFSMLRQREVDTCVLLLREKWAECMIIGRDLVRILQLVAKIPEFERLWRDIFLNPSALSPSFTGVLQLMSIPARKHILASRLTSDMERKLAFMLLSVNSGNHVRYQEWFQRMYLSTPESQSLRCDLIRFICVCIIPSNEQIQKNVPRWTVIGWLLTTCTSSVAASDAKLALFFDWLVFDPKRDNIMSIEPAILVMFNFMRPHPSMTVTLLDFLCRIMNNFCPRHITEIREGIYTALRTIVDHGVLIMCTPPAKNMWPLFNNKLLDTELRILIQQNFMEFCWKEEKEESSVLQPKWKDHTDQGDAEQLFHVSDGEGAFSDDDDDDDGEKSNNISGKVNNGADSLSSPVFAVNSNLEMTQHMAQIPSPLKSALEEMVKEMNQDVWCDLMDKLMMAFLRENDVGRGAINSLAACLCELLKHHFARPLLPKESNDESLVESLATPLGVIFRCVLQISVDNPSTDPVIQLIGEMYERQPRIGYHLLYFLITSKVTEEKMEVYTVVCKQLESRDLKACLLHDLGVCIDDDVRLLTYMIPDIFSHFSDVIGGDDHLVHMIVENIDGTQLKDLICQILQGHLQMFTNREAFLSLLVESLKWETIEQYFLWQLIAAHDIPLEHILPVLPMLEHSSGNAEALTSLMMLLRKESPTSELLRPMLCRECKMSDHFVISVLKFWAQEYEDRLAELIKEHLLRANGTSITNRSRRHRVKDTKKEQPSVEQVLSHLDHMRQVCRNISFLNNSSIQHALQHVMVIASDIQKSRFTDLLALAEDIEEVAPTRVLRGRRGHYSSPKSVKLKRPLAEESASSQDSDSEDRQVRHTLKRKRKITLVSEDND